MHIIYILLYISPLIYTGAAGPPPNGCVVTAHYTGTLESDGSKFDSSRGVFRKTPVHDSNSHGADAFRTLAVGLKQPKLDKKASKHEYQVSTISW